MHLALGYSESYMFSLDKKDETPESDRTAEARHPCAVCTRTATTDAQEKARLLSLIGMIMMMGS